jgi:hypothetical protein
MTTFFLLPIYQESRAHQFFKVGLKVVIWIVGPLAVQQQVVSHRCLLEVINPYKHKHTVRLELVLLQLFPEHNCIQTKFLKRDNLV